MYNTNSRWKSTPVTSRMTSLNIYRKQTKKSQAEVKILTSRVAYINRHFQQLQKQKHKLYNSSKTQKYLPDLPNQPPKFVNPTIRNYLKAQQIKRQKSKNDAIVKKNKQNIKLSNLVKKRNINLHKQQKMQSIFECLRIKQQRANDTRQQKFRKMMRSQREHQRLKSKLKQEQNVALSKLDGLINQQTKLKEHYKSGLYITQI